MQQQSSLAFYERRKKVNLKLANILIYLLVLGFSNHVNAALKAASIDTDTVSGMDASDPAAIKIFAGLVNESSSYGTCKNPVVTSVCNSCTDLNDVSARRACNDRSIHPNLELTLEMTWDSVPSTSTTIKARVGTATDGLIDPVISVNPQANQPTTVSFRWDDICEAASSSDCLTSKKFDLYIGLDGGSGSLVDTQKYTVYLRAVDGSTAPIPTDCSSSDATGSEFCAFEVFPGDAKVFVNEGIVRGAAGPSDFNSIKWKALRVYYKSYTGTPDFSTLTPATADYQDLEITSKDSVSVKIADPRVTGLTNDLTYMFRIASVDEANNVSGFFTTSTKVAQPGEVVGLLDGTDCFIATAAYGSKWSPSVQILRQFRSEVLLSSSLGQKFVQFYYRNSPKVAAYIADNELLKSLVRFTLTPFVWVAQLILWLGAPLFFGLFLFLILMAVIVRRTMIRGIKL